MRLTRDQALALAALGAIALVVMLVSPWSPLPGAKAPSNSPGDIIWRAGYPAGHERLCPPGDIAGGCLTGPHPLYRRPIRAGHNRSTLIDGGWDYIINPPSDYVVQGPGGAL